MLTSKCRDVIMLRGMMLSGSECEMVSTEVRVLRKIYP